MVDNWQQGRRSPQASALIRPFLAWILKWADDPLAGSHRPPPCFLLAHSEKPAVSRSR